MMIQGIKDSVSLPPACSVPKLDEGQLQDDCLDELQNSDVDFISSSSSAIDIDGISLPKRTKIDTTQITTADTPDPFTEDEVIKLHDDSRDKSQCNDSSPACSVPKLDEGKLQDDCQSLDDVQNSDVDYITSSGSAIDFDDKSLPKQAKINTPKKLQLLQLIHLNL